MQEARNYKELRGNFPPEMRLLTALVGQALGYSCEVIPSLKPDKGEQFLKLAATHGVQPLAYAGIKHFPECVPPEIVRHLKSASEQAWIHSMMLSQEIARISQFFSDHQIPMVTLKGPALAAQAYGSCTARTMRDLDILIGPSDFPRTRSLLEANGFTWADPVGELAPAYQEFHARHTTHFVFQHMRLGYMLEVHVRSSVLPALLPISVPEFLAAAQYVEIAGAQVPTLTSWHHFLFVAAHGAKHGWYRLQWVADFAAFLPRFPEGDFARAPGLQRVLGAAGCLSHLCFGTPLPDDLSDRALVKYGVQSLARGRGPVTLPEKRAEMLHFLRLQRGMDHYKGVFKLYWHVTQEDFIRFPLPGSLIIFYPALRPLLWLIRKATPSGILGTYGVR